VETKLVLVACGKRRYREFQRGQLGPANGLLLEGHVPEAETADEAALQKTQPKSIRLEFKQHGAGRFDKILRDPRSTSWRRAWAYYTSKWLNVAQLLAQVDHA
jgi:hypothetical protein